VLVGIPWLCLHWRTAIFQISSLCECFNIGIMSIGGFAPSTAGPKVL
jgi:hypothetical protein